MMEMQTSRTNFAIEETLSAVKYRMQIKADSEVSGTWLWIKNTCYQIYGKGLGALIGGSNLETG
jgi:hypothetical protein